MEVIKMIENGELKKHDTFTIKDLSDEFDITPRTLRHYEDQGLISPERIGQTRVYRHADRVRLAWILRGKRVGFSLTEIGEMLDLYDIGDERETQRNVTLTRCEERIDALKAQKADIDATIEELSGFCALLEGLEYCEKTQKWIEPSTGQPPMHGPHAG
jgi:DNA-binding transcriptional MerR regulator